MPTKKPINKNAINYDEKAVAKFITAKEFSENRLWRLKNKGLFTKVNGKWVDQKHFNDLYPIPNTISFSRSREQIDSRQKYLN